jgi:hypothetical protein
MHKDMMLTLNDSQHFPLITQDVYKINLRDLQLNAVLNTGRQSFLAEFNIPTARLQDLPNIGM